MSLPARLRAAFKAIVGPLPSGGGGTALAPATGYWPHTPSLDYPCGPTPGGVDYAALVGDPAQNGTVAICLRWLAANAVAGPKLCIGTQDPDSGRYEENPDHPLTTDLKRPNAHQSWTSLLGNTVAELAWPGFSYWFVGRGEGGTGESYWFPHHFVRIIPATPPAEHPIAGYEVTLPGLSEPIRYERADVVHFKQGHNPAYPWQGLSPLAYQYRSLAALNAGEGWTAGILRNGVRGTLLTPREAFGSTFDAAKMAAIRNQVAADTGGSGAGGLAGVSEPIEAVSIGFSPEEAMVTEILDRPEEMICSALGLNSMALGLPSSANQRTYANLAEAIKQAALYGLLPLLAIVAEAIQLQLLPAYEGKRPRSEVWFNTDEYIALQEDADSRVNRASVLFQSDIATLNESRERAGLTLLDDPRGEMFKSELGMTRAREIAGMTEPADDFEEEDRTEPARPESPEELTADAA